MFGAVKTCMFGTSVERSLKAPVAILTAEPRNEAGTIAGDVPRVLAVYRDGEATFILGPDKTVCGVNVDGGGHACVLLDCQRLLAGLDDFLVSLDIDAGVGFDAEVFVGSGKDFLGGLLLALSVVA